MRAGLLTALADLAALASVLVLVLAGFRVSRAYLSAVDHEAKLDSLVRVGTSSESFGLREAGW